MDKRLDELDLQQYPQVFCTGRKLVTSLNGVSFYSHGIREQIPKVCTTFYHWCSHSVHAEVPPSDDCFPQIWCDLQRAVLPAHCKI